MSGESICPTLESSLSCVAAPDQAASSSRIRIVQTPKSQAGTASRSESMGRCTWWSDFKVFFTEVANYAWALIKRAFSRCSAQASSGGVIDSPSNTTINKTALKKGIAVLRKSEGMRKIDKANVVDAHAPLKCALEGLKLLEGCGDSNIAKTAESLRVRSFIGGSYEDWANKTESERRNQLRRKDIYVVANLFRSWGYDVASLARDAEALLKMEGPAVKQTGAEVTVVGDKEINSVSLSMGINFLELSRNLSALANKDLKDAKLSSRLEFVVSGCKHLLECGHKELAREAAALLKMDIGECASLGNWSEGEESDKEALRDAWSNRPENHLAQIRLLGLRVAALIKRAESVQWAVFKIPPKRR